MPGAHGDRRIDLTLGIHLEGTDTQSDTDKIVNTLRERIGDIVIHMGIGHGKRGYIKVMSTDDPIHLHNVQQGRRI